ncbi:MAG: tandem-95 repeat protein, partial [Bacteroidales bacterium]|nr:tandem-95 repeat protein [Bacteroidales bacterium]
MNAQLDVTHYIPPAWASDGKDADYRDHVIVLSTGEITPFNVTLSNGDGTWTTTVSISKSTPRIIQMGAVMFTGTAGSRVENSVIGIIGDGQVNTPLSNEGIIATGDKPFFVSIRHRSHAQGAILTSKGTTGLGRSFYSGQMYGFREGEPHRDLHFISVMATEDNTFISYDNPGVRFNGNNVGTIIGGRAGIRLNKGESYVFGSTFNDLNNITTTINSLNGTHITSNKPIAVVTGSWCSSTELGGRDIGFDQIVPDNIVDNEYIVQRGSGDDRVEKVIVVAAEDNVQLSLNGGGWGNTMTNAGDYVILNESWYDGNNNMHILASGNIYVYQTLFGSIKRQTGGFRFIPPLKCTADHSVNISYANTLVNLGAEVNPVISIITQEGSQVTINGTNVPKTWAKTVTGNIYWETYSITRTQLQNTFGAIANNWNFEVSSEGALNASLSVESTIVGAGGYYSGFGDKPQIGGKPYITGGALCAGDMDLNVDAGHFPSYNWYNNGVQIPGEHNEVLTITDPGRYMATGLTPCNGGWIETFPSNAIVVRPCLEIVSKTVNEADGTIQVRVKLTHAITDPVSFQLKTTGETAGLNEDFGSVQNTFTIPAGDDYIDVDINITQDLLAEPDETFKVNISVPTNANINVDEATITIQDDGDPKPDVTTTTEIRIDEDDPAGKFTVTVSLDKPSGYTTEMDVAAVSQTATVGVDVFGTIPSKLTFAPGEITKSFDISINNDAVYEPEAAGYEYFDLQLSNFTNTISTTPITVQVRIYDDENPPVLTISDQAATEGNNLHFLGTLSHTCSKNITIDYITSDLTANHPTDYTGFPVKQTYTLTPGQNTVTFNIPAIDDGISETTESFNLILSDPVNCNIGTNPLTLKGDIFDKNGKPNLIIEDSTAIEGNKIAFRAHLSIPSSSDVSFTFVTSNGTATGGIDYEQVLTDRTVTITAGTLKTFFELNTTQDVLEEGNETFFIDITSSSPLVDLNNNQATGTIIDDDETPDARDDGFNIDEDSTTPLNGDVKGNDLGLGDTPVTFALVTPIAAINGNITFNNDGTFSYTPAPDFNGPDTFDYQVTDADGDTDIATVTITVNPINDVPIANPDTFGPIEEFTNPAYTQLSGNVITNDTGLGDNALVYLSKNVSNGTLVINNDGTFTYDPNPQFFGTDSFEYYLRDDDGNTSAVAVCSFTVKFYNDAAPVANDDNYSTAEDTSIDMPVLQNDTDLDGNSTIDKGAIVITTPPSDGTLSIDYATGIITYTPDLNYNGADLFRYKVYDMVIDGNPSKESNIAEVNINVTTSNDPPVAICKDITVDLDATGKYVMNASEINDGSYDPEGSAVTLRIDGNATKTFTGADIGTQTVRLTVIDDLFASSFCDALVTVRDITPPTVTQCQSDITVYCGPADAGKVVNYTIPRFADNVDGTNLTGSLTSGLSSGSAFPVGITTVTYSYTDGAGNGPATCSFDVEVIRDNIPPVINCPGETTLTTNTPGGIYTVVGDGLNATATDAQGIQSVEHDYGGGGPTLNGATFAIGDYTITWTATDIFGNTSTCYLTLH